MKYKIIIVFVLSSMLSCRERIKPDDPFQDTQKKYNSVTITIPPLVIEDGTDKIGLETLNYIWTEKDSIGIFSDNESQHCFTIVDDVGESSITFTDGLADLKTDLQYYSYFPFNPEMNISENGIPVSFRNQVHERSRQEGNLRLGKHSFLIAEGIENKGDMNLEFRYKPLHIPVIFRIPAEEGNYTSLEIFTEEEVIATQCTISTEGPEWQVQNAIYDDHLAIELVNLSTTDGMVEVIASLPPLDIDGKQLFLRLNKSDDTAVCSSILGKDYILGKAYHHTPDFSVSPALIEVSGTESVFDIRVTAIDHCPYKISTDVDWLSLTTTYGSGSSTIPVNIINETKKERIGHIIISEEVPYNSNSIVLQNIIEVKHYPDGLSVGIGNWDKPDDEYSGTAE